MICFNMKLCVSILIFFFFSRKRRHTSCSRDWSSDVCSSDLHMLNAVHPPVGCIEGVERVRNDTQPAGMRSAGDGFEIIRSEERRVGKECRSRWSPYH